MLTVDHCGVHNERQKNKYSVVRIELGIKFILNIGVY